MKKFVLMIFAAFMAASFASCSDDDNKGEGMETISGFYTINGGRKSTNIPASITSYSYTTGQSTGALEDAFYNANGVRIGDGAQKAIIYGNKMYIAMSTSNIVWVVDPISLKIIKQITPAGVAQTPRAVVAKNGKVYVSMYTGYISELDTTTLTLDRNIEVGPNPDQITLSGDKLIVACSDGQNSKGTATNGVKYGNSCISIVDLKTLTETKIQDLNKVLNPTDAASNGTDAFVVCKGDYENNPNVVKKVVGNDVQEVGLGTLIAVNANKLYVINAPYVSGATNKDSFTYKVYDVNTLQEIGSIANMVKGEDSWILYPNGIAVDPVSGDIVILSYTLDANGVPQYGEPCYANIYDASGNFKKRIECGVGARAVTFIHEKTAK